MSPWWYFVAGQLVGVIGVVIGYVISEKVKR